MSAASSRLLRAATTDRRVNTSPRNIAAVFKRFFLKKQHTHSGVLRMPSLSKNPALSNLDTSHAAVL